MNGCVDDGTLQVTANIDMMETVWFSLSHVLFDEIRMSISVAPPESWSNLWPSQMWSSFDSIKNSTVGPLFYFFFHFHLIEKFTLPKNNEEELVNHWCQDDWRILWLIQNTGRPFTWLWRWLLFHKKPRMLDPVRHPETILIVISSNNCCNQAELT